MAKFLRISLAVLAGFIIIWSFYWFCTRPLRKAQEVGGRTEISIIVWANRDEEQINQTMFATVEREYPGIKILPINATADYWTTVQTMVAGGDPPDILCTNSKQIPLYAGKGVLLDIEPYIEEDLKNGTMPFDFNDYYPKTINSFRFDGKTSGHGALYGLPVNFTPMGFYYNKDLFRRAGVEYPTDDWTWEEFEQKAQAIGRLNGCYGADLWLNADTFRAFLGTYGLDIFTPGFTGLRTSEPEVIAVLERLRSWRFDHVRMVTDSTSQLQSGSGLFMTGRLGMLGPIGRWAVPNLRKIEAFDWDFAQLPRGSERSNILHVAGWCITKSTKHPREAYLVLRSLASPENQRINGKWLSSDFCGEKDYYKVKNKFFHKSYNFIKFQFSVYERHSVSDNVYAPLFHAYEYAHGSIRSPSISISRR